MKHSYWIVTAIIALGLFTGCILPSLPAPEPTLSPLVSPQITDTSDATKTNPFAIPSPIRETVVTRAPHVPGTGAVSGQLERFDGSPLKGILGYAALIEERNGVKLAAVDPLLDVHFITDAQGRFRLDNLRPGDYALAMQSPVGIIMPHSTDGKIIKFVIEADRETDLGRLAIGYVYPDNE